MKRYDVQVKWTMVGTLDVEAVDADDAIEMALDCPLPEGEYLDDSFDIDEVVEVDL